MFCRNCGSQLPCDANFCSSCGCAVRTEGESLPYTPVQPAFAPVELSPMPIEVAKSVDPALEEKKAKLADEAMKLGIIGSVFTELGMFSFVWLFAFFFFPFIVLGLAFTGAAAKRVKEYRELTGGEMVAKIRVGHIMARVGRIVGFIMLGIAIFYIIFISFFIFCLVLESLM